MTAVEQQILSVLEERLSRLNARSMLRRAAECLRIRPGDLEVGDVPALTRQLEEGVRLFADLRHQEYLIARLRNLSSADVPVRRVVSVESEAGVLQARAEARDALMQLGATRFVQQKVVTAVSELARNIVMYAKSGEIELSSSGAASARLRLVARDCGPGIRDLEMILDGRYRSKSGLGRGLLAVRRIAEFFDIRTGADGTVVQAEFLLRENDRSDRTPIRRNDKAV